MQHSDVPEEDPCAPCDDLTPHMRGIECDVQQMSPESYPDCRNICESLLNVEDEKSPRKQTKAINNCKCLCQSLMLKDVCSSGIICVRSQLYKIIK